MKKRKTVAVVSVLIAVALLLCVILSVAKYTTKKGQQSELTSQNFYFSSNFLKSDEVPTYEIYGNTVTFEVRNYIDGMRINDSEIIYTATATEGNLKKADETVIDANTKLKLTGGAEKSESITLTYNFAADELQKEITVSVTGTGDFTQTLQAKFILIKPDSLMYQMKDRANRDYAELYIYMGNTAQVVTLSWDNAELVIDETNDYVFGKVHNEVSPVKSSVKIDNISADTTVKIVFFKKDISQYYTCVIKKSDGTININ